MDEAERAALIEQYADAENLDARIRLHEHDVAQRDWWPWVFDRYDRLPTDADVLEVGCGPGYLWRETADRVPAEWDLLLTDFSEGMLEDARTTLAEAGMEASLAVAAAESLPVGEERVDAVIANHVLYHVDRGVALPEIRRVLRPGGRLLATTNGESNMGDLRELLAETTDYEPVSETEFSLQNGVGQLAEHFETVRRFERESTLRVPDLEPLVAYTASLPGVGERQVATFTERANERFPDPPIEIGKSMGLLLAQKA